MTSFTLTGTHFTYTYDLVLSRWLASVRYERELYRLHCLGGWHSTVDARIITGDVSTVNVPKKSGQVCPKFENPRAEQYYGYENRC
jgi:hypothetical protein